MVENIYHKCSCGHVDIIDISQQIDNNLRNRSKKEDILTILQNSIMFHLTLEQTAEEITKSINYKQND